MGGDGLTTTADPVTLILARVNREQQPTLLFTLGSVTQGGATDRDTLLLTDAAKCTVNTLTENGAGYK